MARLSRRLRSITTIAIVGLVQLAILGAASIYLISNTLAASEASQQSVADSNANIAALTHVFQMLQDTETGERGFVITGNPVFLEPYRQARATIEVELRVLEASGDPDRQNFARLIRTKLAFSAGTLELRRQSGLNAAVQRISGQQGKRLMDAVRGQLAQLVAGEQARLAQRQIERQSRALQAERTIYAVLAIAQLVSIGIGVLLIVYYRRRLLAEREARRRAALLRATLENVEIGIALFDDDGVMRDWNARLARMTDSASDGTTPVLDDRIATSARRHAPIRFETVAGNGTSVAVCGQPAPDRLYVVTYTDISERIRSDRLKNDFISTVSHELRTPLTAIRGALGLLAGPLAKDLPASAVSLLQIADRNAARLTGLVNDLLDIDKIEAGRMELELAPVNLNALAIEAAEANRAFAVQRGIRLAVGCPADPVMVNADGSRLHQVIANLVSNAAKFSPEQGIVTIAVEWTGKMARVSVHDTGGGVPEEFNTRIFGKFAQASSGDSKPVGGSGLGLSISKAIIEQHDGEIGFISSQGNTTFYFTLPIQAYDTL